jgi:2-aminoadipate transaminase
VNNGKRRLVAVNGTWRLPDGVTATESLARAEQHSVSFLPGDRCYVYPAGDDHIRLSFSMYEPDTLAEAARRLSQAFADVHSAAS